MEEEDVHSRASLYGWSVYSVAAAFRASHEDEIDLDVGATVTVIQAEPGGWWEGVNNTTLHHGWFPRNHVSQHPLPMAC